MVHTFRNQFLTSLIMKFNAKIKYNIIEEYLIKICKKFHILIRINKTSDPSYFPDVRFEYDPSAPSRDLGRYPGFIYRVSQFPARTGDWTDF